MSPRSQQSSKRAVLAPNQQLLILCVHEKLALPTESELLFPLLPINPAAEKVIQATDTTPIFLIADLYCRSSTNMFLTA